MELVELSVIAVWNKLPIRIIYDFGDTCLSELKARIDLFEGSRIYKGAGYMGRLANLRSRRNLDQEEGAAQFEHRPNMTSKILSHPAESCCIKDHRTADYPPEFNGDR